MEFPLFLFGYDRSGTTLLSMVIGAHRDIAVPFSATGLWYRYGDRLSDFNELRTAADRSNLVQALLAEERVKLWNVALTPDDIEIDPESAGYGDIVAAFHAAYARKQGKSRWGNIDIRTLDELPRVNSWFPDARFIHIVRDGRDIALSHQTMPYGAGNIAECADKWAAAVTTNLAQGELLGSERYLVVRYEELVMDFETTTARMCEFAGLDVDDGMLGYGKHAAETVPEDRMWLWQNLTQPPDASRVYNWRQNLGRARRVVFESHAGETLERLGYETWATTPKSAYAELLEYYYLATRGHRLRRLLARLGIHRRSELEKKWQRRERAKDDTLMAAPAPGGTTGDNGR